MCFELIACNIFCPVESEVIPVGTTCTCAPSNDIKAKFYPSWATDDDIAYSKSIGVTYSQIRAASWRVCPREQGKKCLRGFFWNELSCQCFATEFCERKNCAIGYSVDPTQTCGDCLTAQEIKYLYPKWATPWDMLVAAKDGLNYVVTE